MNSYSVILKDGDKIGRYTGNSPSQAGVKALHQIFKQTGRNPKHLTLVKNDYTDEKIYNYDTFVYELEEPKIRRIGNKTIEYKYDFKVKRKD